MSILKGPINDAEAAGSELLKQAETTGEDLEAKGAADLKDVLSALLEKASDYKVTFSVSLEKKS